MYPNNPYHYSVCNDPNPRDRRTNKRHERNAGSNTANIFKADYSQKHRMLSHLICGYF